MPSMNDPSWTPTNSTSDLTPNETFAALDPSRSTTFCPHDIRLWSQLNPHSPDDALSFGADSSMSPTHGEQEMSDWNGHYACTCYHPLFAFNKFRIWYAARCVHSAHGWDVLLMPVIARYEGKVSHIYFRADAGFANPEVYEFLEAEHIKYAIRLPANRFLQDRIGYLLKRPVGRPPDEVRRFHVNFTYQAGSSPGDSQGRVASGRALSARGLHRH